LEISAPSLAAYIVIVMSNSKTGPYYIFYAANVTKIVVSDEELILSLQINLTKLLRVLLRTTADRFDDIK
jgi:hypothetical protein